MNTESDLRKRVHALDEEARPSEQHDAAVLANARAAADRIRSHRSKRPSRPAWFVPVSLAASFAIGMLAMRLIDTSTAIDTPVALTLPVDATRGGAGGSIPVEQASPEDWFRYIQELTAAGEAREAQQHLERFNQLHPDFVYQP